jgi:membrane protease YdiL (CAAX protease family)
MTTGLSARAKGWIFTAIVGALAVTAALVIRLADITSELAAMTLWMSTPTLAALIMMLVVTKDGWRREGWRILGLRRSRRRTWPLAFGIALAASLAASAAVWASPLAGFYFPNDGVDDLISFVITIVFLSLTAVLGEELGWRGYLLPTIRSLGRNRALLIVGLVHAAWHVPLILLTTLYHADGNLLVVLPLFFSTVVAASFVFGYLRLASGSVWPATLAHATHNASWALFGAFTTTSHDVAVEEYLAGDNGLLILLATIASIPVVRHLVTRPLRRPTQNRSTPTPDGRPGVPAHHV